MLPFGCTVFATVCLPSPFCSFVTENATILPSSQQSPQRRPRHKSPVPGFEEIGFHNAVSHSRCHLTTLGHSHVGHPSAEMGSVSSHTAAQRSAFEVMKKK